MNFTCFECGRKAENAHHVVPREVGGTRTVPLCEECHRKVHGLPRSWSVMKGIARAKARGVKLGRPFKIHPPIPDDWKDLPLRELARRTGIPRETLRRRLAFGNI